MCSQNMWKAEDRAWTRDRIYVLCTQKAFPNNFVFIYGKEKF